VSSVGRPPMKWLGLVHRGYCGPRWRPMVDPSPVDLLAACEAFARAAASRGEIRPLLGRILAHEVGPADHDGQSFTRALARWARSVRWVREPAAIGEMVAPPAVVIAEGWGDCDDVATAVCAVALTVGLPCRLMWSETGPGGAHMVAIVRPSWHGDPVEPVVIDQLTDTTAQTVGI